MKLKPSTPGISARYAKLYLRLAKRPPSIVVVENLAGPDAVGAINGLLMRIRGYFVEYSVLDPRESAGVPMSRARSFWVMTRQS